MLIKYLKIFIVLLLLSNTTVYSKNNINKNFNSKNLSNYFSAILSYKNQKNTESLKYFNASKFLLDKHKPYLKYYIFSLITEGKVAKAIKELKYNLNKENSDFFEAYLLLTLDSIKEKNFKKSKQYISDLSRFKQNGTIELAIYESLKNLAYLFENEKVSETQNSFGNLTLINKSFQYCYLNQEKTSDSFLNLINNQKIDYSRYIFFYINYLIKKNKFADAKKITDSIDHMNSNLLISQTKTWIDKKKLDEFSRVFSCQNEGDVLSEFFFLIANLNSSQGNYEKSNFYLNISIFLNPKFKFNLSLLADNYFSLKNYIKSKKVLNNFSNEDGIYYWFRVKKNTKIISKRSSEKDAFNFINAEFKKIKDPSLKILFDMANIVKSFNKYELSIKHYNEILSKIPKDNELYADILYRRGGSYERLSKFEKSDSDMLKSLEINPGDPYVLNYLAYSWLERNHKIDLAIKMLDEAYNNKKNDPYILDSVGWAYYLINDLEKAEFFLKKAIKLMPGDPIVNDHYADILWKLGRKIEAKYYWESVLYFDETDNKMKEEIIIKILKGPKKI